MQDKKEKLADIIEKAKEQTKIIMKKLDEKLTDYQKLQEYYSTLDIEWEFTEIVERHDSNWCEWSITGYDDKGNRYVATTQSDGTHPQMNDCDIYDIELDNVRSRYIDKLNVNKNGYVYGIFKQKSFDGIFRYQIRKWNESLERWMFLDIFTFAYQAEQEIRKIERESKESNNVEGNA